MKKIFVTAIDTDSGKTLVSSILVEAFHADYWKPIQAGLPKDSDVVRTLISNQRSKIHPERYVLKTPASPHAAARIDNVSIEVSDFELPVTDNSIVVEGAGGCLVPINDNAFVVDVIKQLNLETIVVADLYLGSINHTLLTLEALKHRGIKVIGIIFNGVSNPESERIILKHSNVRCLLKIEKEPAINRELVLHYASLLRQQIQ